MLQSRLVNLENDIEPYKIEVFTFGYVKILEKLIRGKEDEEAIIKNLQEGLYILKTKNGSRKIYVN
ncbi:MAG: hypothetical protein IBX66_06955 [Lutibacter sp.]|nr:hypothetical protein [Lutibacter sp.]